MSALSILASLVNFIVVILPLLIIVKVFISYFLDPYHPVRMFVDRIIEPMLLPIRRIIPPIGMLDISPLILLIIVQILGRLVIYLLGLVFHG